MTDTAKNNRIAQLEARLGERDVTVPEVKEYILLKHPPAPPYVQQPLDNFVTQKDLADFWALHDYWEPVEEKPDALPTPHIRHYLMYANYQPDMGIAPTSFAQAMYKNYERMVAYCKSEGIDPQHVGESETERKQRKQSEKMAKARAARVVSRKAVGDDPEAKAQYDALKLELEQVQDNYAQRVDAKKQEVLKHQAAMNQAAQERRELEAEGKRLVLDLKQRIRSLTTKR